MTALNSDKFAMNMKNDVQQNDDKERTKSSLPLLSASQDS